MLEVLGELIIMLTFTSALSVSRAGEADVREMLIGSLGCNLAWGIIDAIMYLMNCLAARGGEHDALRAMRSVRNAEEARQAFRRGGGRVLWLSSLQASCARLHVRLRALPEPPARPRLKGDDWLGAKGRFLFSIFLDAPCNSPLRLVL